MQTEAHRQHITGFPNTDTIVVVHSRGTHIQSTRKRLSEFAVARCPRYRRHGTLRSDSGRNSDKDASRGCPETISISQKDNGEATQTIPAGSWEYMFSQDIRELAREILVHICGESCYKYSGSGVQHICRHGYYHVISLADLRRRRRGKPLRNALFVVKQNKYPGPVTEVYLCHKTIWIGSRTERSG